MLLKSVLDAGCISRPRYRASPVYERPFECRHIWACHTV